MFFLYFLLASHKTMETQVYSDQDLLYNVDLLMGKDNKIIVRDPNIYETSMKGIRYDTWINSSGEVEYIKDYYHLIYLPKVLDMLRGGAKPKKIVYLDERQILNVNRAFHIITRTGRYLDISPAGSGKSLMAMVLSIMLGCRGIQVMSGKNIENTWKNMADRDYEGVNIEFRSMGVILGNSDKLPRDILVGKIDTESKVKSRKEIVYRAGKKFKKLIKEGWFIMFDESHQGKNKSNASRGYHAMCCYHCSTFGTDENNSFMMFSSASPSDKEDLTPLFYSLCLVNKQKLVVEGRGIQVKDRSTLLDFYNYTNDINYEGNKKALSKAFSTVKKGGSKKYDLGRTKEVSLRKISDSNLSDTKVNMYLRYTLKYVYRGIFISYTSNKPSEIIKNNIDKKYKPDIYYSLMKLNYGKGFDEYLKIFSEYIKRKININQRGGMMTIYQAVIRSLCFLIIPVILDDVVDILVNDPMRKVIIYTTVVTMEITNKKGKKQSTLDILDYMEEYITDKLKERKKEMRRNKKETMERIKALNEQDGGKRHYEKNYKAREGIVIIRSGMKEQVRNEGIKEFQENNSKCRVIITTPGVLSMGESLDDQYGDYRRSIRAVSNFRGDITRQLISRVHRRNTKSKADILFPIAIGNSIHVKGVDNTFIFDSLDEYKNAVGIKHINLLDIGKVPSGHLNYAIAEILNKKAENMNVVDSDSIAEKMYNVKYIFNEVPKYPLDGELDEVFIKYIDNVKQQYTKNEDEEDSTSEEDSSDRSSSSSSDSD